MLSYLIPLFSLLIAMQIFFFSERVEQGLITATHLRWQVLSSPQNVLPQFCHQATSEGLLPTCQVELKWRQATQWIDPCLTSSHLQVIPPRYYQISLSCGLMFLTDFFI